MVLENVNGTEYVATEFFLVIVVVEEKILEERKVGS